MTTADISKRLAPAIRRDASNQLHVDIQLLLKLAGWEDAEENRDKATRIAMRAGATAMPDVLQIVLHQHECFGCNHKWEDEAEGCQHALHLLLEV
ncbi:MAG: hypothetical protein QOD00_2925 [Blastocatellia bacterium]|jgi:hypothetical protein|nr:hypothetical protein [Blastocatellia bacterium]